MTAFVVRESAGRLALTPVTYILWGSEADAGHDLIWHRDGLVRVVPCKMLREALAIYSDHFALISVGRLQEMPEAASSIYWEQAEDVPNDAG
jgi:hypothetical protein